MEDLERLEKEIYGNRDQNADEEDGKEDSDDETPNIVRLIYLSFSQLQHFENGLLNMGRTSILTLMTKL